MMKSYYMKRLILFAVLGMIFTNGATAGEAPVGNPGDDPKAFLGKWTFSIGSGSVGWLEVRQEKGYLDGDLLWGGGSVLPVPWLFVSGNTLMVGRDVRKVVREKDQAGKEIRSHSYPTWVQIRCEGDWMTGYYLQPASSGVGLDTTRVKGFRLPEVPPAPDLKAVKYGKPEKMLGSNSLTGWRLVEGNLANGWSVADGVLTNNPVQKEGERHIRYGNIRTEKEYEDFNLKLEVNVPKGSNSGVYLRGRHEIQVSDSYGQPLDSHNMGGLYSRITPSVNAEKPAGEWQSMDITLCDRHLTVILNGVTIIDNKPVDGPTGGALTPDVFAPGPIYLQGDHGKVSYRNMVITPILKK